MSDKTHAIESLRKMLRPGNRITCTVLHVSKPGMSRSIMLQIPVRNDDGSIGIMDISWMVAKALGDRFDQKNGGVRVTGCGMDMRFHTVYSLGRVLFPDGFGIMGEKDGKRRRPKSRKAAAQMVRNGWKFHGRNRDESGWDMDGGYALDYRG